MINLIYTKCRISKLDNLCFKKFTLQPHFFQGALNNLLYENHNDFKWFLAQEESHKVIHLRLIKDAYNFSSFLHSTFGIDWN